MRKYLIMLLRTEIIFDQPKDLSKINSRRVQKNVCTGIQIYLSRQNNQVISSRKVQMLSSGQMKYVENACMAGNQ